MHIFIISRIPIESEIESVSYFVEFSNEYSEIEQIETNGIEIWDNDDAKAFNFSSFQEAKDFLNVIRKDTEKYNYSIDLVQAISFIEKLKRNGNSGNYISLKTFYSTTEE